MKKFLKQFLVCCTIAFPLTTYALLTVNEPCGSIYGNSCWADINEVIVVGPSVRGDKGNGIADVKWVGSNIKKQLTYLCEVVSLNGTNFKIMSNSDGTTPELMVDWHQRFEVIAMNDGMLGFRVDASAATGGGKSNGPQITLVCYDHD